MFYKLHRGKFFLILFPKTIYFNFSALPFKQAIRLPVLIGWNVKILLVHKNIFEFPKVIKLFIVRIGLGGSPSLPTQKSSIRLQGGKLSFLGKARMGASTIIYVNGNLTIGENFSTNKNAFLSCTNFVTIGNKVLLG